MLQHWNEPSLAEILSDPVVQAVMAADAVDPTTLNALLRETARKFERASRPSWSIGRAGRDETPFARQDRVEHCASCAV